MIHLKAGQHVYTVGHDVFWHSWRTLSLDHGVTMEDAVGNWSSLGSSHCWTPQHHALQSWHRGSQENGCCYKIKTSCFESTANTLALPVSVFVRRAHCGPSFNLAAGDHYAMPASHSVDIIPPPSSTSMHQGDSVLSVMSCPSHLENAGPHTSLQVCKLSLYFTPIFPKTEGNICTYFSTVCSINTLCSEHKDKREHIRRKGEQEKGQHWVQSWRQWLSAAYFDSQCVIEKTGINLLPAAGVDHLIPYRTSITYIFYYA